MLTSFDLLVWEINKLYPIHSYGILVINTQPASRSRVITRIPYSSWGITNIAMYVHFNHDGYCTGPLVQILVRKVFLSRHAVAWQILTSAPCNYILYRRGAHLHEGSKCLIYLSTYLKIFDKVSHQHLILKLHYYGIRGYMLHWISSFLLDQTQRVICGGYTSETVDVISGVPQGTVLGPLLFLVNINDITHVISSSCYLFADDCIICKQINSPTDSNILQDNLIQVEKWEKAWHMKFNIKNVWLLQ